MTAAIWREFLETLLYSWACFFVGAALWHCRGIATRHGLQAASKILLLMSPVLLSAFGWKSVETVRTAELLAKAPRATPVSDRPDVILAQVDRVTTQGGTQIEYHRTKFGRSVQVQRAGSGGGRSSGGGGQVGANTGGAAGVAASVPGR